MDIGKMLQDIVNFVTGALEALLGMLQQLLGPILEILELLGSVTG